MGSADRSPTLGETWLTRVGLLISSPRYGEALGEFGEGRLVAAADLAPAVVLSSTELRRLGERLLLGWRSNQIEDSPRDFDGTGLHKRAAGLEHFAVVDRVPCDSRRAG